MLSLSDIALYRGAQLLVKGANLRVTRGQRVALAGANGAGKSSLFALILGDLHADSGEVSLDSGIQIAHVAQETPHSEQSALDFVQGGDAELIELQNQLAAAQAGNHAANIAHILHELERIDAYSAKSRAAVLLAGLGFASGDIGNSVNSFSGGWRMRLNLARALMCRSDLLLLDEPTNHLDMEAIIWLENYLANYQGAILLIAHDRYFIDAVCNHVAYIEQQKLTLYRGGYSQFERIRAEHLASQAAAYNAQARQIAHYKQFIERFKAKATKAKQAQSRIKALARMQLLAPIAQERGFHFEFLPPKRCPHHLLSLNKVAMGFDKVLAREIDLPLEADMRIGILGANGAGKSTLLKTIAGELLPLAGHIERHQDLKIGYFAQHQLEQLDHRHSPLEHLQQQNPSASTQELLDFLGGFGFGGERATTAVAPFSGGEKARLALALVIYARPNVLLLDEPTNHLDLEMREALAEALQGFAGAMVIISHDRALLESVCDDLWLLAEGRLQEFNASITSYGQQKSPKAAYNASGEDANNKKQKRQQQAKLRAQLKPWQQKVQHAEQQLNQKTTELGALTAKLAAPETYADKTQLAALLKQEGALKQAIQDLELLWLEAQEALEAQQAALLDE